MSSMGDQESSPTEYQPSPLVAEARPLPQALTAGKAATTSALLPVSCATAGTCTQHQYGMRGLACHAASGTCASHCVSNLCKMQNNHCCHRNLKFACRYATKKDTAVASPANDAKLCLIKAKTDAHCVSAGMCNQIENKGRKWPHANRQQHNLAC